MLTSIVTMDATLSSMAQESVPSVVLALLGCMVAMPRMYLHASMLACDR